MTALEPPLNFASASLTSRVVHAWAGGHDAAYIGRTHDQFRTTIEFANSHLNPTGRAWSFGCLRCAM